VPSFGGGQGRGGFGGVVGVWVGVGGGWYEAAPALCCDVGGEES